MNGLEVSFSVDPRDAGGGGDEAFRAIAVTGQPAVDSGRIYHNGYGRPRRVTLAGWDDSW